MKETLMGNEAIAWALIYSSVDMISGYPGTPSSEILTTIQKIRDKIKLPVYAQWATNEKVGFEVAYAGAISGKRTAVVMKQVGLNVASDALLSASYIGNLGGMVLICADDPGFFSSQTEQDSRVFAKFARIPVLDPSTPQDAYNLTKQAIELSEKFEILVMLRPVMRVCHARESISMDEKLHFSPKKGDFQRDVERWGAVPRNGRFRQGLDAIKKIKRIKDYNWLHYLKEKFEALKGGELLILASGTGYSFAMEVMDDLELEFEIVKIDMPYPLPVENIKRYFKKYQKILIIEEPYPCIEEQLLHPKVHGKLDETMNQIDEMKKENILKAFTRLGLYKKENIYLPKVDLTQKIKPRQPALCAGCPHRDIYYSIMKVFKRVESIYPSDIGCYTLGVSQGAIDTILCMGASVAMASGFSIADKSKTVIATIGDGTFFHSGISPLLNAIYQNHKFILVILDNSTIAMTGRQTTPERFHQSIDIAKIVEGMGIECFEHTYSYKMDENIEFFQRIKTIFDSPDYQKPLVVRVKQFCILDKELKDDWLPEIYAKVDDKRCVACDHCITDYQCPPMAYNEDGKIEIDPFLCTGCGGCLDVVCPTDAFIVDKRSKS
jgi:indolepyruvate ferredoxin oxidoreductase alpha subunit